MAPAPSRMCPGCGGEGRPVWIIDKTPAGHAYLEYAAHDSERSAWTGKFPPRGRVASIMCTACGLILLYGIEYRDPNEVAAEKAEVQGRISIAESTAEGGLSEPEE